MFCIETLGFQAAKFLSFRFASPVLLFPFIQNAIGLGAFFGLPVCPFPMNALVHHVHGTMFLAYGVCNLEVLILKT